MFRRFRNQTQQANLLNPAQLQTLNRANQLVAAGQPDQAAPLFAGLASTMETTNHPRRAANLHAQAAHAYADSQQEQDALIQARAALTLFLQYQMNQRSPVFYTNITRKLTAHGMKNAAATLAQEFGNRVGPMPATAPPAPSRGKLPTNCPKCGGPLHPNEANWIDANTVECEYCSALIQPE
ncbi:MAG: hypothetical protein ABSB41_09875 [Anaerolineales bacterium]|jgi:phytoene dehydrogenase-like protein